MCRSVAAVASGTCHARCAIRAAGRTIAQTRPSPSLAEGHAVNPAKADARREGASRKPTDL